MKKFAKKVFNGVRAAFTTPEAVKAEKSFASFIVTRLLLSAGASAGTAGLIYEGLKAAGIVN